MRRRRQRSKERKGHHERTRQRGGRQRCCQKAWRQDLLPTWSGLKAFAITSWMQASIWIACDAFATTSWMQASIWIACGLHWTALQAGWRQCADQPRRRNRLQPDPGSAPIEFRQCSLSKRGLVQGKGEATKDGHNLHGEQSSRPLEGKGSYGVLPGAASRAGQSGILVPPPAPQ